MSTIGPQTCPDNTSGLMGGSSLFYLYSTRYLFEFGVFPLTPSLTLPSRSISYNLIRLSTWSLLLNYYIFRSSISRQWKRVLKIPPRPGIIVRAVIRYSVLLPLMAPLLPFGSEGMLSISRETTPLSSQESLILKLSMLSKNWKTMTTTRQIMISKILVPGGDDDED